MAISPASDIILDVARAADPQKAMAATRALADSSGDLSSSFADALNSVPGGAVFRDVSYRNPVGSIPASAAPERKAAVGLESLLLKSFIDQMLPKDAADVFGSGVAGDVWRSMLAEKIATQIARTGALKIGDRLFATHPNLLHSAKQAASPHDSAA